MNPLVLAVLFACIVLIPFAIAAERDRRRERELDRYDEEALALWNDTGEQVGGRE